MSKISNPWKPNQVVWALIVWPLVVIGIMISDNQFSIELLFEYGFLPAGIFAYVMWWLLDYMTEKINRQIPDLREWLMQQIYEPPGPPGE